MSRADANRELVGRAQLVSEIVTALDDAGSFGALITGETGVGKTAVARSVLEHLTWSAPLLRVNGGSSLRAIPFGALAPYLHTLSVADAESPVAVLRAIMGHLASGKPTRSPRPPLIVVDDAHELDDSSSALLAQLVSARRAKLLVMMRNSPAAPAEFGALSSDGLLPRFELQVLDTNAVAALCAQVLGGLVLSGTVQTLALITGGNPRLLRTALDQGPATGYLQQRNGVWRLADEQPIVDRRLGDLIRVQLRSRSAEEMTALEVIALAEPIALDTLTQCVDAAALKRLRDDHLVAVDAAPGRLVSLEQPLYGNVLRARVPAARSLGLHRRVLAVLRPDAEALEGFLRRVSWGVDCGALPDDETLLRSAGIANGLRDHEAALRTAREVSAPALRGRALTELARGQAGCGDLPYARELVEEALRDCTDPEVAQDATLLSFELRLREGASYEDLRHDVRRWRSLITGLEQGSAPRITAAEVLRAQLGARILESHVLLLEGRLDGLEGDLRSIVDHPEGTAGTTVGSLILLGRLLGALGRPIEGSTCSGRALDLIEAEGAPLLGYREAAAACHVLLLANSGRSVEAKALLNACSGSHPRTMVHYAGWGDVLDGMDALRGSRNREALDRFLLALEALRESDVTQVMTLLMGMAAYACALAGDLERAGGLVEEFERMPERGSRTMRLGGRTFVTATAALLGDSPAARADLLTIAADAEKAGMKEIARTALTLSLLLGDTGAVEPLVRVLQGFEGRSAENLLAFAVAATARNAQAMAAASTVAGEHGDLALEFAGLSSALQHLGEQGAGRKARSLQRRLVLLGEQREGPVPWPLAAALPAAVNPTLTPTEQKIVALVREGCSNREIADAKSVSVRTVEGHLYRIFAKLGVNRREDLRDS